MTIAPEDVRRMAALAALEIAEADIDRLARQLDDIVAYVAQLAVLQPGLAAGDRFLPGPPAAPLRADEARRTTLAPSVAALGPDVREGLFVVPRLVAMDES